MSLQHFFHTVFVHFSRHTVAHCLHLFLLISGFSLSDNSAADELPWPIKSPKHISSTFGEPRPGRFHFGLDFKSGGVTGKEVIAIGDGYISRVQTTPFGYGKVLYLTLDSGKTAVYGHLSGFLPEIEDHLFKIRIGKGTYDVEWWPKPDELRVKHGQVIAYSGDTGSGPAHLHLEIRDENNIPLNPLNHGIVIRDTVAPVIESVVLLPLDKTSSVNGFPTARWFDFSSPDRGQFVLSGKIGIAASVHDRVDMSSNHLGIYHITLAIDSTVVFSKSYERLPYSISDYGAFDYLSGWWHGGEGLVSALFRRTGNELTFYEGVGMLPPKSTHPDTQHTLTIRASDYAHNMVERSFPVIFGSRPVLTTCGFTGNGKIHIAGRHLSGALDRVEIRNLTADGTWQLERSFPVDSTICDITTSLKTANPPTYKIELIDENSLSSMPAIIGICPDTSAENDSTGFKVFTDLYHDRIVVRIESTDILSSLPVVRIEKEGVIEDGLFSPIPDGETVWITSLGYPQHGKTCMRIKASAYTRSLARVSDIASLEFTACDLSSEITVHAPDSLFSLTVYPESLYRPAPVIVDTATVKTSNGLIPISQGYKVVWGDTPLKESCSIKVELESEPPEKAALYSSGNGNGWSFLSPEHDGRVFTGELGGTGYIAVLIDKHAPYVAPEAPRPGSTITSRMPLLKARVEDKGSGIEGSDSFRMSIDGIPIYGEYDYEAHRISYRFHDALRPGHHTVKITVTDRVGNSRMRSWKFRIR